MIEQAAVLKASNAESVPGRFGTAAGPAPDDNFLRRAVVFFSPSRAAARAFFPAVVCFFGMVASVSGETLRVPPTQGHACRTAVVTGPERP